MLLRKSRIAYHAILGLSCYYFTMELTDAETGAEHRSCKSTRWEEVDKETKKCFESLRSDVAALGLGLSSMPVTILEKVDLMAGITQVIIFEMSMGRAEPWKTHLPAAITLFKEIMATREARSTYRNQSQTGFASVLLAIGDPLWTNPGVCNHIWSPDQGSFRFCAGLLIFIDALASTALQQPPQLHEYHSQILAKQDDGLPTVGDAEIRLSNIVGCRNWIVESISTISWLHCKKIQIQSGDLAAAEHKQRLAEDIHNHLVNRDEYLHRNIRAITDTTKRYWDDRLGPQDQVSFSETEASTLVWAYATRLYLRTVKDRWHSSPPSAHEYIAGIIESLRKLPHTKIRTLAWPLCVAGSLALGDQRQTLLDFIETLPRTQKAGALDDVQQILQEVWRLKDNNTGELDSWSFASCLAVLGSPILLV